MNCRYCSTELPDAALFCGECGRAVSTAPGPDAPADPPAPAAPPERCAQCGAELAPSDIFCGECGSVRASVAVRRRPSDTNVLDPFPWGLPPRPTDAPQEPAERGPAPAKPTEPEPAPEDSSEPPAPQPPSVVATPAPSPLSGASAEPPPLVPPPAPPPRQTPPPMDDPDLDETRIVERPLRGERFVLQFSTGESVSVTGTGLIGRNPVAEPGEYFDTFVPIVDPGRSVSKTHLEFGQEGGAFWISDRYSGNGTVVREPDRPPKRSDPGKRYRLARGTRVDIGEQFFIVS